MKCKQAVWIASPDGLKGLDFADPDAFKRNTYLTHPSMQMGNQGWVRICDAEVTYSNFANMETLSANAAKNVDIAIETLRADTTAKITALQGLKQELLALGYSGNPPAVVPADEMPVQFAEEENSEHEMFVEVADDRDFRSTFTCIKTGCGMEFDGLWFWGDLFQERRVTGDYAFNATSREGEVLETTPFAESPYFIEVHTGVTLKRCGRVIFIPADGAELSEGLETYINPVEPT